MNKALQMLTTLAVMAGLEKSLPPEKPSVKCRLPGCVKSTKHPGGYCCAEHCKQHREMVRESKTT